MPIRHPDFHEDVEDPNASEPSNLAEESKNEDNIIKEDGIKKDFGSQDNGGGNKSSSPIDLNERTNLKRNEKPNKSNEKGLKTRKQDQGSLSGKSKTEVSEVITSEQASRVSLLKPPRLLSKFNSTELKSGAKHGEKKSNIPIFRRSSKEFEDIRSPQESSKRSLIPQR